MYYHIRATIISSDTTELESYISAFNKKMQQQKKLEFVRKFEYTLQVDEQGIPSLFVQTWLDMSLVNERIDIFAKLKQFVTNKGGDVDWHECSHDEGTNKPCVIAEEFKG
jgi:hypothetical protein